MAKVIKYIIFAIVITAVLWLIPADVFCDRKDYMPHFFLAFSALSGTLLGFTISSLSILTAFRDHKLVNNMKKTGHYQELLKSFYITGVCFFLAMIVGMLCFFVVDIFLWKVNLGIFFFSLSALIFAGHRFFIVMNMISEPEGNPKVLD